MDTYIMRHSDYRTGLTGSLQTCCYHNLIYNLHNTQRIVRNLLILFISVILFFTFSRCQASDDENCLMCHKLPGLGIYVEDENQNAEKRLFYINEELFKASYHGHVPCTGCHDGVEEIPHTGSKEVDCASDCHIHDPSTNRKFSHADIVQEFSTSVHGKEKQRKGPKDDLPGCKYCHSNKPYQLSEDNEKETLVFINVCMQCHESTEWAERFFKHINYRTLTRRSSKQVVDLCSQCHANQDMMDNHDLDVVVGFNDTFHGKAIRYGNTEVANCLNCHAPYVKGFSPHSILSHRTTDAPVSNKNKIETCRQSGCHIDATEEFATSGRIHPSSLTPAKMASRKAQARPDKDLPDTELQEFILGMIALFYKALIIIVVGGLMMHQILELLTLRRERILREKR